ATGNKPRLVPFQINIEEHEGKQRIVAQYLGTEGGEFSKVDVATLQAFRGLHREAESAARLVSEWHPKEDTASLQACLRPPMLYEEIDQLVGSYHFVPSSGGKLLLPEELPLLCAFYHMSNVVRYDPDTLIRLMDSKYWPVLLALRRHGTYRFLLLFWSFVNQCSTSISGG
ncbi:MAG: hypothetical protein Q8O76_00395, partial [Chloroflexota bacterium]|nr:hypothetical protein [Chloroflexota bacterium]